MAPIIAVILGLVIAVCSAIPVEEMPMTHRDMDAAAPMLEDADIAARDMAMAKEVNEDAQPDEEAQLQSRSFYPGLGYSAYYPLGYGDSGYVTKTSYSSVQAPGVHHVTSQHVSNYGGYGLGYGAYDYYPLGGIDFGYGPYHYYYPRPIKQVQTSTTILQPGYSYTSHNYEVHSRDKNQKEEAKTEEKVQVVKAAETTDIKEEPVFTR